MVRSNRQAYPEVTLTLDFGGSGTKAIAQREREKAESEQGRFVEIRDAALQSAKREIQAAQEHAISAISFPSPIGEASLREASLREASLREASPTPTPTPTPTERCANANALAQKNQDLLEQLMENAILMDT